MTHTSVSIVVETINARDTIAPRPLADALAGTLIALAAQTDREPKSETIVVLDATVDAAEADELRRRFPAVKLVQSSRRNYFEAKNAGAAAASAEIVIWLDGDTVPEHDWLQRMLSGFQPGVDVVVGRTRYGGHSLAARTFSVADFGHVLEDGGGASGFNLNNVGFRSSVLKEHQLDARIRRNGGCSLLYHQLRAAGARIVYEPRARVDHGLDGGLACFLKKRFERGFDGVSLYRFDERAQLRGTRFFRRFGVFAVPAILARRLALDWLRLVKHRRQVGISALAVPYYAAVMTGTRLVEAAGAVTAIVDPHRYGR